MVSNNKDLQVKLLSLVALEVDSTSRPIIVLKEPMVVGTPEYAFLQVNLHGKRPNQCCSASASTSLTFKYHALLCLYCSIYISFTLAPVTNTMNCFSKRS